MNNPISEEYIYEYIRNNVPEVGKDMGSLRKERELKPTPDMPSKPWHKANKTCRATDETLLVAIEEIKNEVEPNAYDTGTQIQFKVTLYPAHKKYTYMAEDWEWDGEDEVKVTTKITIPAEANRYHIDYTITNPNYESEMRNYEGICRSIEDSKKNKKNINEYNKEVRHFNWLLINLFRSTHMELWKTTARKLGKEAFNQEGN